MNQNQLNAVRADCVRSCSLSRFVCSALIDVMLTLLIPPEFIFNEEKASTSTIGAGSGYGAGVILNVSWRVGVGGEQDEVITMATQFLLLARRWLSFVQKCESQKNVEVEILYFSGHRGSTLENVSVKQKMRRRSSPATAHSERRGTRKHLLPSPTISG